MPQMFDDVGEIVEEALRRVGKRVVLALPLGIGKPNLIANEFFRRARADAALDLTIFTALQPAQTHGIERSGEGASSSRWRRASSATTRSSTTWQAVRAARVPPNVRVIEFFFEPGSLLNSAHAQSHYLSANYTHVARELLARGVNVIAHVVAKRMVGGATEISLGSNPDVTVDLLPERREAARRRHARGDAGPGASRDALHAGRGQRGRGRLRPAARPFALRLRPVRAAESRRCPRWTTPSACTRAALVRDGGTLQIGIGELGDSIVYSLLLRHQQNEAWRRALDGRRHGAQRGAHRRRRRPRAVHRRPVRRHRDVRRPDARPVPRRHPAPPRLRLSTAAARAGRERLEHARRRSAARGACWPRGAGPVLDARDVAALKAAGVLRSETPLRRRRTSSRPTASRIEAESRQRRERARRWRANAWGSSCRAAR